MVEFNQKNIEGVAMEYGIYDSLYKRFPPEQADAIAFTFEKSQRIFSEKESDALYYRTRNSLVREFPSKSDLTAVEERLERKILESKWNSKTISTALEMNSIALEMSLRAISIALEMNSRAI